MSGWERPGRLPGRKSKMVKGTAEAVLFCGLLFGFLDPVSGTAEFNTKLRKAGLNRYIAEKQRQFDVWYVNNHKDN